MGTSGLSLGLLGVAVFSLATALEPWFQTWAGNRAQSADILGVALGDSRRLFAKHVYAKADAYFHGGYYPSIFDNRPSGDQVHVAAATTAGPHAEVEHLDFGDKPRDWLEAFSRHFYPATHAHLGEAAHDHDHEGHDEHCQHARTRAGDEREILPWLRLAATLDPAQPDTYVVAAFWLRTRLGRVDEAEQFLRQGLMANPGQPDILFELGRIYREHRRDPARARNAWELALHHWREQRAARPDADSLLGIQLLAQLAKLEEDAGNYPKAIEHLTALKGISPSKDAVQKWLDELKARPRP